MIIKVKFKQTDESSLVMLFGNSYKPWQQQFEEYVRKYCKEIEAIEALEKNQSAWKSWGGLKWCQEENFQDELNREGCQDNDTDNPNPRQYRAMNFGSTLNDLLYAIDYLKKVKVRFG